jgi:phosphoglycolate phosphatase
MTPLVAFDLDGTLVDSRRDLAESANELLATYGASALGIDVVAAMVGDGARQLVERVLDAAGVQTDVPAALERFLGIYAGRLVVHTRPYRGTLEALAHLRGRATLALLTNKPEGLSRQIIDAFAMSPYFAAVIGGDSGFPRKPDPAGLRALIALTGTTPPRTVYIGDSMIDVETARAAGARVVVARYGFGHLRQPIALRDEEASVDAPADIPGTVERVLAMQ